MKFTNIISTLAVLCAFYACSNKTTVSEPPPPPTPADTSSSKVVYWLTTSDETVLLKRQPALAFFSEVNSNPTIEVDTTQTFQQMYGYGYTLTGGSATLINGMSAEGKAKLLNELFGNDENSIHVNFIRISIGASDLSANVYTYNDIPAGETDPNLDHFSLEPDKTDLIPLLKEIIAINPDILIIATPWTAPVWMKTNQNSVGGSLKPEYYGTYAKYFVKYIKAMETEGIRIVDITPQNEPLHDGNNPSMLMTAPEQADFIKNHLGPAFDSAGIETQIYLYDHNCDKPDYPISILEDPIIRNYVAGSAFHLYAGDIAALSQVHNAYPGEDVYFTEQFTSSTGSFGGDLRWHLRNIVVGAPRNWSRTVFEWNLANDVTFGPHTPGGCTTCKGALTINGDAVKRNVAYYIIAHISKFVPNGSVRINSNIPGTLTNVAFKTKTGEKVAIVLNDNDATASFNIRFNGKTAKATLPAGSVGTYIFR
jgi:glucosylceramidase